MDGDKGGERALIISADGHASARMADFRPYLEEAHHEEFDAFLVTYEQLTGGSRISPPRQFFQEEVIAPYEERMIASGAIDGEFDPAVRLEVLAADGVAAEVLFPNNGPFGIGFGGGRGRPELVRAGSRAHNRWMADFAAHAPSRLAGQAILTFLDLEEDLATIAWAKERGLRGLMIPGVETDGRIPALWDPALDPIWSACEETGLPVNLHAGAGIPEYGMPPQGVSLKAFIMITGAEFPWFAHRPLWFLVYGGVLERHPRLKVVFTEQHSDWVPGTLAKLDYSYTHYGTKDLWDAVPMKPSEYWARQCWLGASLLSRTEAERHDCLGLDKMMFGVDFPHVESTFGRTGEHLRATIGHAGLAPADARRFLGGTAAEVFGIDTGALAPVVEASGHPLAELLDGRDEGGTLDVARPAV